MLSSFLPFVISSILLIPLLTLWVLVEREFLLKSNDFELVFQLLCCYQRLWYVCIENAFCGLLNVLLLSQAATFLRHSPQREVGLHAGWPMFTYLWRSFTPISYEGTLHLSDLFESFCVCCVIWNVSEDSFIDTICRYNCVRRRFLSNLHVSTVFIQFKGK